MVDAVRVRGERGATLIVVAMSLSAMLGVSALAIDGGRMFSARRQTQNGADSAALAGAEALFAYQYAAATNTDRDAMAVNQAVIDKLTQNDASNATCQLVDAQGTTLESCAGATDAQLNAASGVHASGTTTRSTALAGTIGVNNFTVTAGATASIDPLAATASPFIVCGASQNGWGILDNSGNIITPPPVLNNIPIESAQVPTCGAGSDAFKGKAAPGAGLVAANSAEAITTGNGYNSTASNAVAALSPCPPTFTTPTTCGMIIPIASSAQGTGSSTTMQIATFAIFNVTYNPDGNPRATGTYVAPSYLALQGRAAFGVHCNTGSQVCMVKLSA